MWTDTLDNDTRAYIASKGWDRLDGDAAAQAVVKSYREIDRMRPEAPPKSAAEYDFSSVKLADGSAPDAALLATLGSWALDLKLPVSAAPTLANHVLKLGADAEASEAQARTERLAAGETAIKGAWGAEYEAKSVLAQRAFEALGLDAETRATLATSLGFDKVMELGHGLGLKMGEAPLLKGEGMEQKPTLSPAEAMQRRNAMTSDPVFGKRLMEGDPAALQELKDISAAVVGTQENWSRPPPNFNRYHDGMGHEVPASHELATPVR